jgi:hypothetical protein
MEGERRVRHAWLWLSFIACMVGGAALVLAGGALQAVGFALLVLPIVALSLVALAYYLVERRRGGG